MTDEDVRVSLARLAGQLEAHERQLERLDQTCERRAGTHVDRDLYASERKAIREDLKALSERASGIERDLDRRMTTMAAEIAETRREDARTRRWLITLTVSIVLGVATVIVGVIA